MTVPRGHLSDDVNDKMPVPCEHCRGTGIIAGIECRECRGKGHRVVVAGRMVNAPNPDGREQWRRRQPLRRSRRAPG
jgi:DnaJ-class molecular chaperone